MLAVFAKLSFAVRLVECGKKKVLENGFVVVGFSGLGAELFEDVLPKGSRIKETVGHQVLLLYEPDKQDAGE